MTRTGKRFCTAEPVQYTIRWRAFSGEHGHTILMACNCLEARNQFRRAYPQREVISPVKPCRTDAPTLELAR
jgi:hypothetical protein